MSNSLDQDQDQRSVGPYLGLNYFERLSADDMLSLARKEFKACDTKSIFAT